MASFHFPPPLEGSSVPTTGAGTGLGPQQAGRPWLNRIKGLQGVTALFFLQKNRLHYPGLPTGDVRSTDLPGAAEMGDVASQPPSAGAPDPRDPEARQGTLDRKGRNPREEADQGRGPKEKCKTGRQSEKEEAPGQNGGWPRRGSNRR